MFGTPNDNTSDTEITSKIFPNIDAIKEYLKKEIINPDEIYQAIRKVVAKLNRRLPNYKHIKKFKVVSEELEKTTTRKIKRFGHNVEI